MLVEFYGMPGSGKSHIHPVAEQVFSELHPDSVLLRSWLNRMRRPRRMLNKAAIIASASLFRPGMARRMLTFVSSTRPALRWCLVLTANWIYVYHSISRHLARGNVAILDQAFFQALWSTYYFATIELRNDALTQFLRGLLDSLRIDRLVVFVVNADAQTLRKRVRLRRFEGSPLERGTEADIVHAWEVTSKVRQVIDSFAIQSSRVKVRDLDNGAGASFENVRHDIQEALRSESL